MPKITKAQFKEAAQALVGELAYQDSLPRRTEDGEAKDPAAFATLARVYLRKLEDNWAMNEGNELALHDLRKCAAIFVRAMIYCGVRERANG